MKIRSTLLAANLFIAAASAQATVIDFNDLTIAPGGNVLVTEQYAGLGVHFSSAPVTSGGITYNGFFAIPYYLDPTLYPGEPSSFYDRANNSGALFDNVVTATFDQDVSNVSLLFADTEIGSILGYLKAYDAHGSLLASTQSTTPNNGYPGYKTLALNVGGIRSVTFQSDVDGAIVDDFTFTSLARATVPEPGMLGLLGLGFAGLAFGRKKA